MFAKGEFLSFIVLRGKSKLEVPGSGGVGGRVFRGLPASDKVSGVPDPYDPVDVLLCCSEFGDLAGAELRVSHVALNTPGQETYTFPTARQRL